MISPGTSGLDPVAGPGTGAAERYSEAIKRLGTSVLDLLIATYSLVLMVIALTGGVDLGIVSLHEAAKPVLVLLLLVPLRITIGEPSPVLALAWRPVKEHLARMRQAYLKVPHAAADVGFALLATFASTLFIAFVADLLFAPYQQRAFAMPFKREKFAQIFAGWDSGWYFDIASRGYYFTPDGQSSVAFFPLYPMLMRAAAWPFGGSDRATWIAGIVVSCAAFALALVAVHRFTERVFGDRDIARRTVLYLAIFPFSLFFTRVYAESVFLLTSVLALSQAYDGRWGRAGLFGALATLARPNGILIGLPLALLALAPPRTAPLLARRLAALGLLPLALGLYCAYVYSLSGDPLAWLSAQAHWGYSLGHPPWEQLLKMVGRIVKYGLYDYFFVSNMASFRLFHGVVALVFLALVPAVFKRLGLAMGAYVLVSLLVPLSGNALEGVGRYSAVLFPMFMVMASARSPRVHEGILVTGSLFLALFVSLFATGRPIY